MKVFYIFAICLVAVFAHAADVTLAWDANTEPVEGYRMHYGTASKVYTTSVDVENDTQYTVTDLEEGVVYYFAVTAYANQLESDYSNELAYTIRPGQVTIFMMDRPQKLTIIRE